MSMEKLYEAATNSLASDSASENCWTKMCEVSESYVSAKDLKEALNETETRIKTEYSLTKMPSPWRSAKSIVLASMNNGLQLRDPNSQIKGKSAIQAELKALKVDGPPNYLKEANRCTATLISIWDKLDMGSRLVLKTHLVKLC